MKLHRFTLLIAALLITSAAIAQQSQVEPSATELQKHVSYLASDKLDGRRTGTQGANDAARYIAAEFERLGLRPAPATDSRKINVMSARYLQTFSYIGRVELGKNNVLSVGTLNFRIGEDWMPLGISTNKKLDFTEVVFAGYGITAAELNHNDYKGTYS